MNIILILFIASFAWSQDFVFDKEKGKAIPSYVGQVKLLKGKAYRKNEKGTKEVKTGERFKKNDLLITEDKSFAKILIVDDTVISIGPRSELRFDDIDFNDKSDRKLTFSLLKGQVTGDIKNKAKEGDIKFKTRYTSMGVRGTYFLMNHQELNSLHIAEYALLSGKVDVTDDKKNIFPMEKGEKLVLVHDSSREISAEEKTQLGNEVQKFKPFLPLFKLSDPSSSSPLYQILNTAASPQESEEVTVYQKRKEKRFTLDQKLDQLNRKLRENHKKR